MEKIRDCSEDFKFEYLDKARCVSLGKLSPEMISFIHDHIQYLGASIDANAEIIFWKNRVEHTEQHKDDFFSEVLYENCIQDIPHIIHNPDFIAARSKDNSISFIKRYSQNVAVVVRVTSDGGLSYRTMYPLLSSQLDDYLKKGTAWPYNLGD